METVFFYIFSAVAVFAAIMVVIKRNPIISAVYLILCFFALAALYVLLAAHLVAVLQVLVYAGAIMVLVIFVIMLMNLRREELREGKQTAIKLVSGVVAAIFLVEVVQLIRNLPGVVPSSWNLPEDYGTIKAVGTKLFTDFLLPFELVSVLLLIAIIGAVVLSKRKI